MGIFIRATLNLEDYILRVKRISTSGACIQWVTIESGMDFASLAGNRYFDTSAAVGII